MIIIDGRRVKLLIEEANRPEEVTSLGFVDLVILCFNIMSPSTLHSLYTAWSSVIPPYTPVILVGCQADLRKDTIR